MKDKYKNWTVTNRRTENIRFSRMLAPAPCNESEDAGAFPYEILTIELSEFVRSGFVSAEFKRQTLDIVEVQGRYFTVGKTTCGKHEWLSVSLPPELDPTPRPREWDVYCSGDKCLYDPRITGNPGNRPVFKVREVCE
jgi:hypothetical protein